MTGRQIVAGRSGQEITLLKYNGAIQVCDVAAGEFEHLGIELKGDSL